MCTENELIEEENRRIRHLKISVDILVQILMTRRMTLGEAERLIQGVRTLSRHLFPGKEDVFDLVYMPRFHRALREAGLLDGGRSLRMVPRENR